MRKATLILTFLMTIMLIGCGNIPNIRMRQFFIRAVKRLANQMDFPMWVPASNIMKKMENIIVISMEPSTLMT